VLALVLLTVLADAANPASADAWAPDDEQQAGIVLAGRAVPSLIAIDPLQVRLEPDDPPVGDETTIGSASVVLQAEAHHDLDGPIRDLRIGVAILPRDDLEFVWKRLIAPPLRIVPAELERAMPSPSAVTSAAADGDLASGDSRDLDARDELESIALARARPLAYLAAIGGYELVSPSVDDVVRVLEHGGPVDLSALASWANQAAGEETIEFDDDGRGRIMDQVETSARALRAPPGWGDFARLAALTAVAHACARPEDLERLLALQRPMGILVASGIVSWDAAANEEHVVGVAIHGFSADQSRSQAAIAWEQARARLRITALDRLLRLSFDPIDFRDAPAVLRRSPLQPLADDLLAPLAPTQVERVLATAASVETEAAILRYYVEVRHEAVAEPLVEWLIAHPERIDDVGVPSLAVLGEAVVPVLLRRHGEVDALESERALLWRLLDALPERMAGKLAQSAHSLGVELPAVPEGTQATIADVLAAIRRHEQELRAARADELVERVREDARDRASLRIRIRAAGQLAQMAPERIPGLTDELIDLHTRAAMEFDDELPGELRAVLRQLVDLPLGERRNEAARAAALTQAELAVQHGDATEALAQLEAHDPALADAAVRERYARILRREVQRAMATGDYPHVEAVLERAAERVPDLVDVSGSRLALARARNFPLIVTAAVLLVLVSAAGGWLLHAASRRRGTRAPDRDADAPDAIDAGDPVRSLDTDVSDVAARHARGVPQPVGDAPEQPVAAAVDAFDAWQSARDVERRLHSPLDDFGASP